MPHTWEYPEFRAGILRSPSLTHFISFAPEYIYPLSPSCSPTASIMSGWLRAFAAPLFLDAAAQQMFKSPLPSVPPQNLPNPTTLTSSAHPTHHLLSRQPLAAQEPGLGHASCWLCTLELCDLPVLLTGMLTALPPLWQLRTSSQKDTRGASSAGKSSYKHSLTHFGLSWSGQAAWRGIRQSNYSWREDQRFAQDTFRGKTSKNTATLTHP